MDSALVIARLQQQAPDLRRVAGAADFASAAQDLKVPPAAYVLALQDLAGVNGLVNATAQHLVERFGVVIAARNLADGRGAQAREALLPLRQAVFDALLGWAPAAGYDPVEYVGGRLLHLTNNVLWWQMDFQTGSYLRSV